MADHRERISESLVRLLVGLASSPTNPAASIITPADHAETGALQFADVLLNPNEEPINVPEAWDVLQRLLRNYRSDSISSSKAPVLSVPSHQEARIDFGDHGDLAQVIC